MLFRIRKGNSSASKFIAQNVSIYLKLFQKLILIQLQFGRKYHTNIGQSFIQLNSQCQEDQKR